MMLVMVFLINGTSDAEEEKSKNIKQKFNRIKSGSYNHKLKRF